MSRETDKIERQTISAVIICKDEERDLPGLLRNLLPWVDEVVLVDDGSVDRTLAIARSAGDKVRVVEQRFDPDTGFSGQRNRGIEEATSSWLLHMDVDERVSPELRRAILGAVADERYNGYRYRRLNFFLHRPMRHGGWQKWNSPQLGRRGFHRFENAVHEQCEIDGGSEKTGQLQGYMWHLNDADFVERLSKNLRYSQLEAKKIISRQHSVGWYDLALRPLAGALRAYLWERAFLDGTLGLIFGIYTFSSIFNWWACAWDLQNRVDREALDDKLQSQEHY